MGLFDRVRNYFGGAEQGAEQGAEHHVVRGFPVLLRRLDEALGLIATHQPWRFAHLARDVERFWIVRYPCRGAFLPESRACLTELTFLARTDITAAPVASSILHEGMHARVHAMGVSPVDRDMAHEERICRRAELAFGQSLPTALGAPVIERAAASLLLEDAEVAPAIDWAEAQRRQEVVDTAARRGGGGVHGS